MAELGLELRAGFHSGRLNVRADGDVSGIAVNVAARALGKADAAEALVTRSVTDLITGAEFEFEHHRGDYDSRYTRKMGALLLQPRHWPLTVTE